jgi:hypothetical protein
LVGFVHGGDGGDSLGVVGDFQVSHTLLFFVVVFIAVAPLLLLGFLRAAASLREENPFHVCPDRREMDQTAFGNTEEENTKK